MTGRLSVTLAILGLFSIILVLIYNTSTDKVDRLSRIASVLSFNRKPGKAAPSQDTGDIVRLKPKHPFEIYDNVETFVMFIGHGRSGHSIVGSLLDAHPDVIIAHESNILGHMDSFRKPGLDLKWERYLLFYRLQKNSARAAESGINAETSGGGEFKYSYHVPGQWQGTYRDTIKVIGDKKGGETSTHLIKEEKMADLEEIGAIVGVPVKFIHIIRNPFDNIATKLLRVVGSRDIAPGEKVDNEKRLNTVIQDYFARTEANEKLRQKYGDAVIELPSRGFVLTPKESLMKLCEFLGITCEDDYLEACTKILHGTPSVTRNKVVWTEEQKRWVHEEIQKYSFLQEYNFDSP